MESFKIYMERLTRNDLQDVEFHVDAIFRSLGIDIEFTKHFIDRVNDTRNQTDITKSELENLFKKAKDKFGGKIHDMKPNHEAVITDLKTWINLPFVLKADSRGNLHLIAKTVMRKKNFTTRTKKLFV
jgi:hypothetical protein